MPDKHKSVLIFFIIVFTVSPGVIINALAGDLIWPVDCTPGVTCHNRIGYPDIDGDGQAFDCSAPGYRGHQGTDIGITWSQMDSGVSVFAAADGFVLWVFEGKYDRCPDQDNPDCQAPPPDWFVAGESNGYRVCTELGNYCGTGGCCCFWCFDGGNVVVIKHSNVPGVFATRYDHLRTDSILVSPGEFVQQGQKIAQVGSAGHSIGPHLHFEVWGTGYYELADPWAGPCGPNFDNPLWKNDPPYACTYNITPESQTFDFRGGSGSADVETRSDCSWNAESKSSWIRVTSSGEGIGSDSVIYSVLLNPRTTPRTGTLAIARKTFTVNQHGAPHNAAMPWIPLLLLDY